MAEAFEEPYHVPQQSRRVKLREPLCTTSLVLPPLPNSNLYTNMNPVQNQFLSLSSHSPVQPYLAGGPVRSSVPLGPFTGYGSVLKGSRFLRPAQQMMEEMCNVARGGVYEVEREGGEMDLGEDDDMARGVEGGGYKSRLVSMLDEVYKKYKYYYQQMQAVVSSFESVPGLNNAAPFANLALNAMSRHFRTLKNAIINQLRFGNKSNQNSRKGENSAFGDSDGIIHFGQRSAQNMALHDNQPVWRPQRGLPERAVTMLRAWLFDHFLHPYPTDTDKMMLAKQTGLSRNQVSNWFINARVRLWKPMVEEIHNLETSQIQKSSQPNEQTADVSNSNFTTTTSFVSQYPSTFASKAQDLPSKRAKNEFRGMASNVTEESLCSYYEHVPNHQVFVGGDSGNSSGTGNISLTLGLHQNHGIRIPEPFPMTAARRFGLDANTQGYVLGNYETQNQEFGRNVISGQLFHDFVG